MNVESEKIIATDSWVSVINPAIPSVDRLLEIDGSIESKTTFEIYPEPTDLSAKSPLEFIIHSNPGTYVDLTSFYIDVKLKLVGGDGTRGDLANWKAYFINHLSQSLWSVINVFLNDTSVESNYNNQQVSNLAHILSTPQQLITERGYPMGLFLIDDKTLLNKIGPDPAPLGNLIADRINFSKQESIHLRGPIHLDIGTCDRFLADDVKIKIVLQPAHAQFLLNQFGDAKDIDYELESVKIGCTKIKPSEGTFLATTKKLMNKPFEYIIRRNITHVEVIPQNYTDYTIIRPFQDLIPGYIYIFLVDREAASGSFKKNPFFYGKYGLKKYSVKINGIEISGCDITEKSIEAYCQSQKNHGSDYFIPYKHYNNGCFVLCVNTQDEHSSFNALNIERKGNLNINLQFNAALPDALLVHVVGSVDSTFDLDADRVITTNYQY